MPTKKTAKKVSKKVARKAAKKTAKKAVRKSTKKSRKPLVCAPGEHCFWVTDGSVLSNLMELRDALNEMSDDVFTHHVTKEKNDFADWIEHILEDAELAKGLRKSKKPKTAHKVIVTRLRVYSV